MCGRFTLTANAETIAGHFQLSAVPHDHNPRYNIAPGQAIHVITQAKGAARHFDLMLWGLIPFWAKDPGIGHRMINARAETISAKPAFRHAFKHGRCLIPADGFYEWRREKTGKQPFWIGCKDRGVFAFAGLWERWVAKDGSEVIESCAIITRGAQAPIRHLHDRMPVLLQPEDYSAWIDEGTGKTIAEHILQRDYGRDIEIFPVTRDVNTPRNDHEGLIKPIGTFIS